MKDLARIPVKELVRSDTIKSKFNDVLGKRAPQFISSIVNIVNSNQDLKNVDQTSVISSALVAASLDLPINQSFGYMYLVPYSGKAQPQMGYKGYIQLAQRSGQYKRLNAISVSKEKVPDKMVIFIPDYRMEEAETQIDMYQDHIEDVKAGRVEPTRCGKCDYCKSTAKLGKIVSMDDLID
ncbi:recombinase RecT [Companilactobacillus kedongensis]|uniref:recombinase RecT n=1 Tax=Companilactobacillus kedongensis TaxID=2486004 RepID=UPI00177DB974|nr:recombinase RecT [Companilactobacillus kedongensis]